VSLPRRLALAAYGRKERRYGAARANVQHGSYEHSEDWGESVRARWWTVVGSSGVWCIVGAWEAGVWLTMGAVLIAPMLIAALLFLLASRMQDICILEGQTQE